MPYNHKVIHEKEITFVQASDSIDLDSSVQAMNDVLSDKEHNPDYKIIVDIRKTDYNPSMIELFTLRDSIVSLNNKINNGIIVISRKELLNKINMAAFLAKVYNLDVSVYDNYDGLEELESHL